MTPQDVQELLQKYRDGKCTDEEKALIESWYLQYEQHYLPELPQHLQEQQLAAIWESLPVHEEEEQRVRRMPWWRIAAAAVVFIALGTVAYYYVRTPDSKIVAPQQTAAAPIVPGGNKAFLILGDGSRISLTDATNGQIAQQAGIVITKQADGQLLYTITDNGNGDDNTFNTIETPKGGQYQVSLPDGTKVWLNAATSLRFPARFAAGERKVYLDGEAYFEVISNKKSPFKVSLNNQEVEVLGTHFNVMAYKDEATIRTTLLEGAVKLSAPVGSILLAPGEQGYLNNNSGFSSIQADIAAVVAWKNGLFVLNGVDLRALMRQIGRWYDIEVVYEPGVKDDVVYGSISRSAALPKLLQILETGDVHFRVEGRKLIVMP